MTDAMPPEEFSQRLLAWFDEYGRHDLPWQEDKTPYRVWVSEIMLQQTQVKTVIPYYQKFMQRFPAIEDLAQADQDEVLTYWAGLGYYARGRNLHKAAQKIVEDYHGQFPEEFDEIVALPGIGRSTAGAILSIAHQKRFAILDGNVKRVLARFDAIESWPGERQTEKALWERAETLTPVERFGDYTQAIMDLGATLCSRSKPGCERCPVRQACRAFTQNRVAEFPFKKPKKDKPVRSTYLLILRNAQGKIWLEKRPPKGIWGGLWSFPELETWQACQQKMETQFSQASSLLKWQSFRHSFSHYHLDITPVFSESKALEVRDSLVDYSAGKAGTTGQWIDFRLLLQNEYGLPAPVQKLIETLENY